jgi:hypothetical protein
MQQEQEQVSAYEADDRVVPVGPDGTAISWDDIDWDNGPVRFELPSPEGWFVVFDTDAGQWMANAANEDYQPMYRERLDTLLYDIIGDPK